MNKHYSIIILSSLFFNASNSMDKPQDSKLAAKYPSPINWQNFEAENLDEYARDETVLFLFAAISHNAPVKVVRKILVEKELSPNCRNTTGHAALTIAVLNRNTEAVVTLLTRKAKVVYEMDRPFYSGSNDEYQSAITPWQAACLVGQEKYLRLVHAKMNVEDQRVVIRQPMLHLGKELPIDYALTHGKTELVQFLNSIDKYLITENYAYQRGENAAGWHDATYLKILFERIGMFLDSDKNRLLAVAVNVGNLEGTQFLISKGAQVDTKMCASAALQENSTMLEALCQTGVSLKAEDNKWHSLPLRECLHSSRLTNTVPITLLLAAGANEHTIDQTQTIHAIANKYFAFSLKKELVETFRAHRVKLDTPDKEGRTLLHHTCESDINKGDDEFMFYLLDLGANPNIADQSGTTPFLMFCKSNRNPAKLSMFLQTYAPDVNVQDQNGRTPLIYAAAQGKKAFSLIGLLLNYHADIAKSRDEMLMKACRTLNVELAQSLIENHHANAKHVNSQGQTALMEVIKAHNFSHKGRSSNDSEKIARVKLDLIELLVKNGAALNAQDEAGNTALHCAVETERLPKTILKRLLDLGANAAIYNAEKKTPLEVSISDVSAYSQSKNKTALLLAHTKEKPIILSTGQTPIEYLLSIKRSSFDKGSWNLQLLELFTSQN